jgi:hypothetical protein
LTSGALFAWLPRLEQTSNVIGSDQTPGGGPDGTLPTGEPGSDAPEIPAAPPPAAAPPAAPRKPGRFRRTVEWFWRGRALAELRKEGIAGSPRASELLRRGFLALEVAKRTLDPPERFAAGPPDAVAWELSRQAVYWGLRADRVLTTGTDDAGLTLAELSDAARPRLIAAAGGEAELGAINPALSGVTFVEQSELALDELGRSAHALNRFARALLLDLERPRVHLDRVWFQRLWRCGGLLALLLLLVFGAFKANGMLLESRDVARGKPWRTSSVYTATTSCPSPKQKCAESPFFFFHTLDDDRPWLEIDLQSKQRIVGAIIENREDCCADRAVPLVIQVSTDHKNWKEVARRTEIFGTWSPTFAPVSARWVRIMVMKKTSLHLHRASILR